VKLLEEVIIAQTVSSLIELNSDNQITMFPLNFS